MFGQACDMRSVVYRIFAMRMCFRSEHTDATSRRIQVTCSVCMRVFAPLAIFSGCSVHHNNIPLQPKRCALLPQPAFTLRRRERKSESERMRKLALFRRVCVRHV